MSRIYYLGTHLGFQLALLDNCVISLLFRGRSSSSHGNSRIKKAFVKLFQNHQSFLNEQALESFV